MLQSVESCLSHGFCRWGKGANLTRQIECFTNQEGFTYRHALQGAVLYCLIVHSSSFCHHNWNCFSASCFQPKLDPGCHVKFCVFPNLLSFRFLKESFRLSCVTNVRIHVWFYKWVSLPASVSYTRAYQMSLMWCKDCITWVGGVKSCETQFFSQVWEVKRLAI